MLQIIPICWLVRQLYSFDFPPFQFNTEMMVDRNKRGMWSEAGTRASCSVLPWVMTTALLSPLWVPWRVHGRCVQWKISIYTTCAHEGSIYTSLCSCVYTLALTLITSGMLLCTDAGMSHLSPITSPHSVPPYGWVGPLLAPVSVFLCFTFFSVFYACMALWSWSSHPAVLTGALGPIRPSKTPQSVHNA